MPEIFHILCTGDDWRRDLLKQERLKPALENKQAYIVLYGREHQGLGVSEAQAVADYLLRHEVSQDMISLEESVCSTSEMMALVARDIKAGLSAPSMGYHIIPLNWPHLPRARYLLRREWQKLAPLIPWGQVEESIKFIPVPTGYEKLLRRMGLAAIPWWVWNIAFKEMRAWLRILLG